MIYGVKDLAGYELAARDGSVGRVLRVLFDDQRWVIRHLVVETGSWLSGRTVLISPHAVLGLNVEQRQLHVALTQQQVRDAPGVESDLPVSRQYEIAANRHYGYPHYWGGTGLWGMVDLPLAGTLNALDDLEQQRVETMLAQADPTLRSSAEVSGYEVQARDGSIGHVDDFLFDTTSWQIALVVVDTRNWLPDRLVLVPPVWVERVDWDGRSVHFKVSRAAVDASPPYQRHQVLDPAAVQRHFEHSP